MNQGEKDYLANRDAIYREYTPADQNHGIEAGPSLEVGGVLVLAYVKDGQLNVSIDYDTADVSEDSPFKVYGEGCIPTVVSANGITVWDALPE